MSSSNEAGSGSDDGVAFAERARAYAEAFASASELDLTAQVTLDDAEGVTVAFDGPDAPLLAARRGQVLDALQLLATYSLRGSRSGPRPPRLTFDAAGYRVKRAATLRQMAQEVADEVKSTGQEAVLDPLSPLERRIVHTALVDDPGVTTYSEGEEPDRYIIISPRA